MRSYKDEVIKIINDNSASMWIKRAIEGCNNRDVVNVLNDLGKLQWLFMMKFEEMYTSLEKSEQVA